MISKDEALKMAIEALETTEVQSEYDGLSDMIFKAINACKEALKPNPDCDEACMFQCQMEKEHGMTYEQGFDHGWEARLAEEQPAQEPVKYLGALANIDGSVNLYFKKDQWQGLTDDEIKERLGITGNEEPRYIKEAIADARAIEAKLKENNHGS